MKFELSAHVTGIFQIEKFKEDGTITYRGEPFHNLVLNNGLLSLCSYTLNAMCSYVNLRHLRLSLLKQ